MIGSSFQRAADSVMAVMILIVNGLARANRNYSRGDGVDRYINAHMLVCKECIASAMNVGGTTECLFRPRYLRISGTFFIKENCTMMNFNLTKRWRPWS